MRAKRSDRSQRTLIPLHLIFYSTNYPASGLTLKEELIFKVSNPSDIKNKLGFYPSFSSRTDVAELYVDAEDRERFAKNLPSYLIVHYR